MVPIKGWDDTSCMSQSSRNATNCQDAICHGSNMVDHRHEMAQFNKGSTVDQRNGRVFADSTYALDMTVDRGRGRRGASAASEPMARPPR